MPNKKWVDYQELKERVSFRELLAHYGLLEDMKEKGDSISGACPIHKGDNATSFRVTPSKGLYHCFSCDAGGNVIDFVATMEEIEFREAAIKLSEIFNIESKRPKGSKKKKPAASSASEPEPPAPAEQPINKPLSFSLSQLDTSYPYLADRGLSEEEIEIFGLGFCNRGIMKGRIAIPIHNAKGELVAYAGRFPGEPPSDSEETIPKYKFPEGFHKSLELWNLHRVLELRHHKILTIVEGFFDAIRLHRFGVKVVATMGSSLSERQAELVVETVGSHGRVDVVFDNDEAGRKGSEKVIALLAPLVYVKSVGLPKEDQQPEDLSDDEIKELLL